MLGKLTEVLAHFGRTRRTVQTDHVNTEWLDCGKCGANLRTHQHGSGGFDSYLDKNRKSRSSFQNCHAATIDRSFGLKEVLRCFDQEGIRTTLYEPNGLLLESVSQKRIVNVTQAWKLGSRPHGP